MTVENARPAVFISYSHDSDDHKKCVHDLCNRLVTQGVHCYLDQYEQFPEYGWPRWMKDSIQRSDFVLVICSEGYNIKMNPEPAAVSGKGVVWESLLLEQKMYDAHARNPTIVPVLLKSSDEAHIPSHLKPFQRYCVETTEGYDELYRLISKQPRVIRPPLGETRSLQVGENSAKNGGIPDKARPRSNDDHREAVMRKSRFTEEQIVGILQLTKDGQAVSDICRQHGISKNTFYRWKALYGRLDASKTTMEHKRSRSIWLKRILFVVVALFAVFIKIYDTTGAIFDICVPRLEICRRLSSVAATTATPAAESEHWINFQPGASIRRRDSESQEITCQRSCGLNISNTSNISGEVIVESTSNGKKTRYRISPGKYTLLHLCLPGEYYIVCDNCKPGRIRVLVLEGAVCPTGTTGVASSPLETLPITPRLTIESNRSLATWTILAPTFPNPTAPPSPEPTDQPPSPEPTDQPPSPEPTDQPPSPEPTNGFTPNVNATSTAPVKGRDVLPHLNLECPRARVVYAAQRGEADNTATSQRSGAPTVKCGPLPGL